MDKRGDAQVLAVPTYGCKSLEKINIIVDSAVAKSKSKSHASRNSALLGSWSESL